jgi:hypothetical protein
MSIPKTTMHHGSSPRAARGPPLGVILRSDNRQLIWRT